MATQMITVDSLSQVIEKEQIYLTSSTFKSCDELLESVRAFYFTKGYGISIRNSKRDQSVTLQCDRGGSYRDVRCNGDKRKRSSESRLINCPFRIVGNKRRDGVWVFKVKDLKHNHEPCTDGSRRPSFRGLPPENVETVKEMTLSGVPPREILSSLQQQIPNFSATSRTIYNLKAKIRRNNRENRLMVSALFEELKKCGFLYDVLHNGKGHITRLFVAHPLSIKLAKVFSNIFVMDCTYKADKYNMYLLDIMGVSCFNTSFYSGFAFLEKDDEESYIWALSAFKKILGLGIFPFVVMSNMELALMNAIRNVFPTATSLLFLWDIQKNVLANCKKDFECDEEFNIFMSSWNNVVCSTTEALFMKNWGEFELFYNDKKDAIEYIKNILLPWKEKIVSVSTEKYLHFGNRSSSGAEDAHAKFISYLEVCVGGLEEVQKKICLAIEHEFNEIKGKLVSERIQVPTSCNMPLFRDLLSYVSPFALKEIYKQYEKIKDGTVTPCTGHFMATMGLPCAHKIEHWHGTTLSLELIHPHWRIDAPSLNLEDGSNIDGANGFIKLLNELYSKYQSWPPEKKEFATLMISKLINESDSYS